MSTEENRVVLEKGIYRGHQYEVGTYNEYGYARITLFAPNYDFNSYDLWDEFEPSVFTEDGYVCIGLDFQVERTLPLIKAETFRFIDMLMQPAHGNATTKPKLRFITLTSKDGDKILVRIEAIQSIHPWASDSDDKVKSIIAFGYDNAYCVQETTQEIVELLRKVY